MITYILNDVPPRLRAEIERDAEKFQSSLNEVVRQILCHRYRLRCQPVRQGRRPHKAGTTTMILRLDPKLFHKLQARAARNGKTMKQLILEPLEAHYKEQE